jgi:hypothetical protein
MPHHEWGDNSFDWKSLYEAERIGGKLMERFARIGVNSKEKYGTIRWDLYLFNGTMHSLTHPGYVYSQYPKWLWAFDVYYEPLRFLKPLIIPWQKLVVKLTFLYLSKRYLHIVDEIISDAPRELLTKDLAKRAGRLWVRYCRGCNEKYTCDNEKCPHCGDSL